jgi:hypothetical protein
MSLTKARPTTGPVLIPTDVGELPKLPSSLKDIDPEGVSAYEENMQEYWLRLADAINSLSDKLDSEN